jgi:hypothetical protein
MSMTIFELARVLSAMASGLFLIGLITFATGVSILVIRSIGKETRAVSKSILHITEKGIAISGSVFMLLGIVLTLYIGLN